jgi:putative flippase GtrA
MFLFKFVEDFIIKLIKFCLIGFTGLIVDFGLTYFSKEILKIQKYISNAIGFTIATSTNYFLNRVWTFKSKNPDVVIEYTHFLFISLTGLVINSLILWVFVSRLNHKFYFSKLIAIIVTTFWNFFANYLYTFAR